MRKYGIVKKYVCIIKLIQELLNMREEDEKLVDNDETDD